MAAGCAVEDWYPSQVSLPAKFRTKRDEFRFRRSIECVGHHDLERVGSAYGGFSVPTRLLGPSTRVLSAGLGEDASFDLGLVERFGCTVHSFDPTPRAIAYADTISNPRFVFHPYGVWGTTQDVEMFAPRDPTHVSHSALNLQGSTESFTAQCLSLDDALRAMQETNIDLLKMNIEGAEGSVLDSLVDSVVRPKIMVVAFEEPTIGQRIARVAQLRGYGYEAVHVAGHSVTLVRAWGA